MSWFLYPFSLLLFASGMSRSRIRERKEDVKSLDSLESVLDQRIETLSKGFKRRVGLALAILHDPEVLVLDEPTDGLDPNQKHDVRELIRSMAKGKVIVLSTHILEEVEAVCTRAIIVSSGRIQFDGTPGELRGRSRFAGAIEVAVVREHAEAAQAALRALATVASLGEIAEVGVETRFVLFPHGNDETAGASGLLDDVQRVAADASWRFTSLSVDRGRMDDVFREVTTSHGGGA